MKQFELKKDQSQTLIETINDGAFEKEYVVDSNAQFVLVIIIRQSSDVQIRVRLVDRGAFVYIIGFVVGSGDTNIKLRTLQMHKAPETMSNLLVKSVLSGSSYFSYDGGIQVEKNAQKTDAYQRNENILLSQLARVQSKPKLEILANDVRCTHGATTGMLSQEELWYLATRGIERAEGQKLLIDGFFQQAISTISDTISQQKVRKLLWQTEQGHA